MAQSQEMIKDQDMGSDVLKRSTWGHLSPGCFIGHPKGTEAESCWEVCNEDEEMTFNLGEDRSWEGQNLL